MIPSRQNTKEPDDPKTPNPQIHFVVWMLERGIDLMGPGVECVSEQRVFMLTINAKIYAPQKCGPSD
jgi:hypothetical protein